MAFKGVLHFYAVVSNNLLYDIYKSDYYSKDFRSDLKESRDSRYYTIFPCLSLNVCIAYIHFL